jgi:hypothetical protein
MEDSALAWMVYWSQFLTCSFENNFNAFIK